MCTVNVVLLVQNYHFSQGLCLWGFFNRHVVQTRGGGEVGQHNVCEFESVQHDCQLLWILSVTMCTGQSCFLPFKGSRLNYNVY